MPEVQISRYHNLEYAALRTGAFLLGCVPVSVASAAVGKLWRWIAPLTRRHKRVLDNLALAMPELSAVERSRIAHDQWENLGKTFAETFALDRIAGNERRFEIGEADKLLTSLSAPGRGAVFVSLHSANWELVAKPVKRHYPLIGIYQQLRNPASERFLLSLRGGIYDGGLLPKVASTPAAVMRWVREGKAVAMLADQREKRGNPVTFFGVATTANPFPAMVARRLGVPLIAARTVRLGGVRFRIDAVQIPITRSSDPLRDVQYATQAVQDQFESWIRDRPGEWMWVNDRWRHNQQKGRTRMRWKVSPPADLPVD
ncbi:KDO2-lipid IV(A) lauroyltransferase [Faunimonas pinastri]|uniref:KDO2-lipid IV(A) lauroyltransferase n=1 Tax=Faunimonas pinastri TaxID=1855383 RepID=A0A1H9LB53_9HYPH|nr:hypothetical protein [Faunimonas pinastri]SER08449.1 KDO2-lipid IV(A) lauroyltransferase [Faunimonas pinastri]